MSNKGFIKNLQDFNGDWPKGQSVDTSVAILYSAKLVTEYLQDLTRAIDELAHAIDIN